MKKQLLPILLFLTLFLTIGQIYPVKAAVFPIKDARNDVYKKTDIDNEGDYCDEIDIVKLTLSDSNLELTLQATPIIDYEHEYTVRISWDDTEIRANETYCTVGRAGNATIRNYVHTTITIGSEIVAAAEQDIITAYENKLSIPITNFHLLTNPSDPKEVVIITTRWNNGESWADYCQYNHTLPSLLLPGLTTGLTTIGLCITAVILRKIKKRKNYIKRI